MALPTPNAGKWKASDQQSRALYPYKALAGRFNKP
jgi:hypothetical protein